MGKDTLTKKQWRHLRELAGLAYERELGQALDKLLSRFDEWKKGNLTPFDIDREIHVHHDGIARDLYRIYVNTDYDSMVRRALKHGILDIEEVREDCRYIFKE